MIEKVGETDTNTGCKKKVGATGQGVGSGVAPDEGHSQGVRVVHDEVAGAERVNKSTTHLVTKSNNNYDDRNLQMKC